MYYLLCINANKSKQRIEFSSRKTIVTKNDFKDCKIHVYYSLSNVKKVDTGKRLPVYF